jgi:hypothetical protein
MFSVAVYTISTLCFLVMPCWGCVGASEYACRLRMEDLRHHGSKGGKAKQKNIRETSRKATIIVVGVLLRLHCIVF